MKKIILLNMSCFFSLMCIVIYPPFYSAGQTDSDITLKKDTITSLVLRGLRAADSANKTFDKILFSNDDKDESKIKPKTKVEKVYITKKVVVPKYYPVKVHDTVYLTKTKYIPVVSKKAAQQLNIWFTDSLRKLAKQNDSLAAKTKKKHKKFLGL